MTTPATRALAAFEAEASRTTSLLRFGLVGAVTALEEPGRVPAGWIALQSGGVDSLLALDLRKKLTQATGHKVPLAKILGGITGTELIEHLIETDKESTVA